MALSPLALWRQVSRGWRVLTRRAASDRDLADEVRHFLAESTAAYRERGLSPEDAERAARRDLGAGSGDLGAPVAGRAVEAVVEDVRAYGWENAVEATLADLRLALRRLAKSPGFAALAVLTVALGVGATAAIFSAVDPVLLRSLPYPKADRIATIWERRPEGGRGYGNFGTFRELAARSRSFAALAVLRPWQPTLTGVAEPERLEGQRVSAAYFRVLGVVPALGRDFDEADDRLHAPRVALLADTVWRRRFAADPGILGRTVALDGDPYEVIGVLPRGFDDVLAPAAEVWTPLQYDMSLGSAWGHHLRTVGRLVDGVALAAAEREVDAIVAAPRVEPPPAAWAGVGDGLLVAGLQDDVTRGVRPALLAVSGAVLLVLLLAGVNLAHLLLGRGAGRRGELAVRAALGAGRGRLVRQLATEGLVLAALGGLAGLGIAALAVRALVLLAPAGLPRASAIALDGTAVAFGMGLATVLGVAMSVVPAWSASRREQPTLRDASRRTVGGSRRLRGGLVVAETALAVVLLVGTGLLLRSLSRLLAVPPGFEPAHVLTLQVQTAGHAFDADGARQRFFARALAAVRAVPGVESAGWTSQLPLSGDEEVYGVRAIGEDAPPRETDEGGGAFRYAVSPGYLETLGIPLLSGRRIDVGDRAGATPAVLLSASLARRLFHGADPLGRRVYVGPAAGAGYTVVGVVGETRQQSLAAAPGDAVYVSTAQWPFADAALWLTVRSSGEPDALREPVRRAIASIDRDQPVLRVAAMAERVAASAAERRFALVLFSAFAAVALLLAGIGVYGVLAEGVEERRRELGVRAALGATRAALCADVLGRGLRLAACGAAAGLIAAWVASAAVASLLYGVSRADPATYGATVGVLALVAALACAVPAWRASRVDPATTLRAD